MESQNLKVAGFPYGISYSHGQGDKGGEYVGLALDNVRLDHIIAILRTYIREITKLPADLCCRNLADPLDAL